LFLMVVQVPDLDGSEKRQEEIAARQTED